jgi:hypothetical protein
MGAHVFYSGSISPCVVVGQLRLVSAIHLVVLARTQAEIAAKVLEGCRSQVEALRREVGRLADADTAAHEEIDALTMVRPWRSLSAAHVVFSGSDWLVPQLPSAMYQDGTHPPPFCSRLHSQVPTAPSLPTPVCAIGAACCVGVYIRAHLVAAWSV